MTKTEFADYLRYRMIEWIAWCASLFLLKFVESVAQGSHSLGSSVIGSAVFDAISLVAFGSIYVYGLFFYPVVSLSAFFIGKVLRRGRPAGRIFWMIVNVGVPLSYGLVMLFAIYEVKPDLLHVLALACAIAVNVVTMRWKAAR